MSDKLSNNAFFASGADTIASGEMTNNDINLYVLNDDVIMKYKGSGGVVHQSFLNQTITTRILTLTPTTTANIGGTPPTVMIGGVLPAWQFDNIIPTDMNFTFVLPPEYADGTIMNLNVNWFTAATSGTITWVLLYGNNRVGNVATGTSDATLSPTPSVDSTADTVTQTVFSIDGNAYGYVTGDEVYFDLALTVPPPSFPVYVTSIQLEYSFIV